MVKNILRKMEIKVITNFTRWFFLIYFNDLKSHIISHFTISDIDVFIMKIFLKFC